MDTGLNQAIQFLNPHIPPLRHTLPPTTDQLGFNNQFVLLVCITLKDPILPHKLVWYKRKKQWLASESTSSETGPGTETSEGQNSGNRSTSHNSFSIMFLTSPDFSPEVPAASSSTASFCSRDTWALNPTCLLGSATAQATFKHRFWSSVTTTSSPQPPLLITSLFLLTKHKAISHWSFFACNSLPEFFFFFLIK